MVTKNKIRDYRYFKNFKKKNLNQNLFQIIKEELYQLNFYKNNLIENFFFKKENCDKIVSQYLITEIYLKLLNKKIIQSFSKKIYLPMNSVIYDKLNKFISIHKLNSVLSFSFFVFKNLLLGIGYYFYKIFEYILKYTFFSSNFQKDSYFISLKDPGCINEDIDGKKNILSWFNDYENDKESRFFHNVKSSKNTKKTIFLNSPINILEFRTFIIFIFIGFFFILLSIFHLLIFRWKMPLLSKEILSSVIIRNTSERYYFKNYFFNNTSWIFKPLWTYDVENKNSKVLLYFYSMNIENIKKDNNQENKNDQFWDICTWKNYLVWNEHHKQIVKNFLNLKNISIDIVGPIPYSDSIKNYDIIIKNEKKKIALFDISPHREYLRLYFNTELEFYNYLTIKKFLLDILETNNDKVNFYFKIKRPTEDKLYFDRKYLKFIEKLNAKKNLSILPPQMSAFKIAELCDGAISLPFTSTAHIFKSKNKLSKYYDPISFFNKKHYGARGIEILYKEDLNNFLKKI